MQKPRYIYRNTWATDGIRAFRHVADASRKPHVSKPAKFRDIEKNLGDIKKDYGNGRPLSHFGAIVGIDLGHIYSAAAFALQIDDSKPGSQLKISNKYLYGRQRRNLRLLEERKARCGISYLEEELSRWSKHVATLETYVDWIRQWQKEKRLTAIPDFYNSLPVRHLL